MTEPQVAATPEVIAAAARARAAEADLFADPVFDVRDLSLWYGDKQALKQISLQDSAAPHHRLHRPLGLRQVHAPPLPQPPQRPRRRRAHRGRRAASRATTSTPRSIDVIELRKRIGMVFQKSNPFPMSIFENVVYGCASRASPSAACSTRSSSAACAARRCGTKSRTACTRAPSASPAASSSGCASPAPSPPSPRCSCSTSPAPPSTPSPPPRSRS